MYKLFLDDKMYLTDDKVGEEIERLSSDHEIMREALVMMASYAEKNYIEGEKGYQFAIIADDALKIVSDKQDD